MKINYKRLEKLEQHLRKGKLGHKKFDFSCFNSPSTGDFWENYDTNKCGSAGCALGEMAVLAPKVWRFSGNSVILRRDSQDCPFEDASKYFGIDIDATRHLFNPESQNRHSYGGKFLYRYATKTQVADNIKTFIKVMKVREQKKALEQLHAKELKKINSVLNKLNVYED